MKFALRFMSIFFLLALTVPSHAAVMTFTDRASFNAAVFDLPDPDIRVFNFDGLTAGDLVPPGTSLGGITFTYSIDGLDMKISDLFGTTSGNNYLGLDDPGNFDQFIAGDAFNLNLGGPFNALGMYFVTGDPLFVGDIILQTPVGDAVNSDIVDLALADGGLAYFLGLVSTDIAFGLAQVRFNPAAGGTFLYNVDDIVTAKVPVPGTLFLLAAGVIGMQLRRQLKGGMR